MTIATVLVVLAGTCAGGFVSGVSGFAFGLVALTFWVWLLDPHILGPMVIFGSCATQISAIRSIWRELDWPRLLPFLAGGLAGIPVGMMLLERVDIAIFKFSVGVVLVVFSSSLLLSSSRLNVRAGGRWADSTAGFVGGVMGGLAGLNGPAPVIWCTVRGWDKTVQRSIVQSFILVTQVVTFAGYAASGQLTRPVWEIFGLMLPAVFLSAWIGAWICDKVSDSLFRRIILILLLLSGLTLMANVLGSPQATTASTVSPSAPEAGERVQEEQRFGGASILQATLVPPSSPNPLNPVIRSIRESRLALHPGDSGRLERINMFFPCIPMGESDAIASDRNRRLSNPYAVHVHQT